MGAAAGSGGGTFAERIEPMDWDELRGRLESIWGVAPEAVKMPLSAWNRLSRQECGSGEDWFWWRRDGDDVWAFRLPGVYLTERERRLIELVAETARCDYEQKQVPAAAPEEERLARRLSRWLLERMESGISEPAEPPEPLAAYLDLGEPKVPFLLYAERADGREIGFAAFRKLLESFFSAKVPLVPLTGREWLLFGPASLIADVGQSADDAAEACSDGRSTENGDGRGDAAALTAAGEALYEMIASESIGECHVAVARPIDSFAALVPTVAELRETLAIGRAFRIGHNVHVPWQLRLERLLAAIPERERARYIGEVLPDGGRALDAEMRATLELFFEWGCNVSETAKRLYVHRNTLLYRLDKFRQETGLDVRTFRDAVRVYVALLLYKATKKD